MVYGVPVGSPEYVTYKLKEKAKEIISDAEKARQVLSQDRQALWSALRLSIQQRFEYLMKLVAPSLCKPVAKELDAALWKVLEAACGFQVPRGEGGLVLRLQAVHSLSSRSFQEWVVRQPVRLYGWGLRSLEDLCGPAYIGTLETALPFMAGRGIQLCPQLAEVWGGPECWGDEEDEKRRWRRVLESGCREGVELRQEWGWLRLEAMQCSGYLREEVPEVFQVIDQGVGEGSVSGATRTRVVEAREDLRTKVLAKLLQEPQYRHTRAALSWPQRDKISSAWLLAIPAPDTALSNAEFGEAGAASLCLPSPGAAGMVGEPIRGRKVVDVYGDEPIKEQFCRSLL